MDKTRYIIERRDKNGKLLIDLTPEHSPIMKLKGVNIDQLVTYANNHEKSWVKCKFGFEVGKIGPQDIDGWLKSKGLTRRKITWGK